MEEKVNLFRESIGMHTDEQHSIFANLEARFGCLLVRRSSEILCFSLTNLGKHTSLVLVIKKNSLQIKG